MSDRSARSLGRASAKAKLSLPQVMLDALDQAIRNDDVANLKLGFRDGGIVSSEPASQNLLLNLLQRSISARSKDCIAHLLGSITSLDEPDDINERNCLHRLVIHIGRNQERVDCRQ